MDAETIAKALGGRKTGSGWTVHCPAHDDQKPSCSLRDAPNGGVLVYCHAGCSQEDVVAALKKRRLWRSGRARRNPETRKLDQSQGDSANRVAQAVGIWLAARPGSGSIIEQYLAGRAIEVPVPAPIRFHPGLRHGPSGEIHPAMVALVTSGSDPKRPLGIHRTYLERNGRGKARVAPSKMMLGPCAGGAVQLTRRVRSQLMVGEGIETTLAAMQAFRWPAWAALSTSGLRSLPLPTHVREVIVLADGDDAGEAAAQAAALRWSGEGRRVRIARPPAGLDFNDMLLPRRRHGAQR